jgi:hypothetical protein
MKVVSWKIIGLTFLLAGFGQWAVAGDDDDKGEDKVQVEPIELLINFKISGSPDVTTGAYAIGGPGYAPDDIGGEYGEVSDEVEKKRKVAMLSDAQITFSGGQYDPIVNFSCLPGTCKITFKDGSELMSAREDQIYSGGPYAGLSPYVKLEGRAINKWGPIVRSPDFDYINGIFPTRILGCGGLIGTAGRFKGMVGSICFNGQLNFNANSPVLTGSSKCTIVLHTPAPGFEIPEEESD